MEARGKLLWFAAILALTVPTQANAQQINTIREIFERLRECWKPPPRSQANPVEMTIIVAFTRAGDILGHPRVTYETDGATDNDRLAYRIAAMEALQRCTPLPFTDGLGGAVAGRPFTVRFSSRKTPRKPAERQAWLTPKIL